MFSYFLLFSFYSIKKLFSISFQFLVPNIVEEVIEYSGITKQFCTLLIYCNERYLAYQAFSHAHIL